MIKLLIARKIVVAAVLSGGLLLSGCGVSPHADPVNVDLTGVWTHEEDGNIASVYFAADGNLIGIDIPQAVLAYDVPIDSLDWDEVVSVNGCWETFDPSRIDGGDSQFSVTFLGEDPSDPLEYSGTMRLGSEDMMYLYWGFSADPVKFSFERDISGEKTIPDPISGAPTCKELEDKAG